MGILKGNLRAFGSSASGAHSTNSTIINGFCAVFLAGLILSGGSAKAVPGPYNVLINPGAERGDLTGWNASLSGYIFVVSTNNIIPNATNKILAHSGANTFQMFDVTADSAYMYQDYAAAAGSTWSASTWAICYASNFFSPGAIAYMSVAFYDMNGNVLLNDTINPDPGTIGVYGSVVLDPDAPWGIDWIITPPPAIDATGWLYLPATNFYYDYTPVNTNGVPGANIEGGMAIQVSTNLTAPPGTAFVRYKLEFDNSAMAGGAVYWDDCQLIKVIWSDPDITNPQPVGVSCYIGDPASFTVKAVTRLPAHLEKLTYQWQKNGTDLPKVPGGDIVGASTNATLLFTDCQVIDSGMYSCLVTDTNGSIRSIPVPLTVTPQPCPTVNRLGGNAGFENAPLWPSWIPFNGCSFASTNSTYDGTNQVNIFDGKWCAEVGINANRDNGFWQAIKGVTPGSCWKAGGWAYISSLNDFAGANTCRIMIRFMDAYGQQVPGTPIYESVNIYGLAYTNADMQYMNIDTSSPNYGQAMYHDQMPRDQWCYLPVTNMVNNIGIGLQDDLPTNTVPEGCFMVPTNASIAQINYLVYEYCPQFTDTDRAGGYLGNAADGVYWDDMELVEVVRTPYFTVSLNGTNINLSFGAIAGLDYSVLYKTHMRDDTWNLLTTTNAPMTWQTNSSHTICDYYPITVSDQITRQHRYYWVKVK
jgi:hypothetical protein